MAIDTHSHALSLTHLPNTVTHSLTHSIAQTITELCDLDGYADDSVSYAPRWAPPYSDGPCVEGYESWVARDGLMPASMMSVARLLLV